MIDVAVLTIDGPAGSGKGTVARLMAKTLGWHYLDSGAIYRVLAYATIKSQLDLTDVTALIELSKQLEIEFSLRGDALMVLLAGEDVTNAIRAESVGDVASKVALIPPVRSALLARQRAFRQLPGLVADGRDMGTVVFPEADYKIFLTASDDIRAKRRYKQLKQKGINSNLADTLIALSARDKRDSQRQVAPLQPAEGALQLDSTTMDIQAVFERICAFVGH